MRMTMTAAALIVLLPTAVLSAAAIDNVYKLGPDSQEQPGVPHGKVVGPTTLPSSNYPEPPRDYWAYVPAQYDPA